MLDSPPAASSAMDGYAVRDADLPGALRIIGESFAGAGFEGELEPGTCVRIFTGAPVPAGADRVVIQEVAARDGALVGIADLPGPARYIRPRGSDFRGRGRGRRSDRGLAPPRRAGARHRRRARASWGGEGPPWRDPGQYLVGDR